MPDDFALKDWLALSMTDGVGPTTMRKLLRVFGSPGQTRRAGIAELSACVPARVARNIKNDNNEKDVKAACRWAERENCRILTLADKDYPPLLLEITDAPPLLYAMGDSHVLTNRPLVAVVGSRSASSAGVKNTEIFARALSEAGVGVVSGMAQGVDSAAHRGALQGPAGTVAVLGTGIDIIYPKQNRTIAMKIVQEGGLMVSDFPLGTPPMAGNFPRRNRIISGLARACLVVEATVKSGSLITAELAAEQGREVFAVPGSINSPLHRGCHRLIKQGAKLAENVSDVLEELKLRAPKTPLPPPPKPGELLSFIDFEPTSVDDIAERSGMVAQVLLPELLILEMEGKILPAAGGTYQRV
ncbi:DNA-processing protein DprA [Candidatus Persebacteraceae bacterium Df01]|jgi:DNA processing protein|uniref:DNA-processing protein DprA n=1 Tax=Candidatus Doriopsillibacter californiensis TaxID=2970740 RepID=A0ABT7QNU7_9GAMM|nr:DNA-processing protein DprA [Candidatus Persebacteraceae bacterium Df01]